ncbi:glutathione synthetase [Kwoniella dejecticola CBS 10117]|uniref:Glutathione synthetase n=1 Tax=Kwoniella dejecticola CBS 10117 TaxID=1296121 RepID=A0A1A6AC88_9TREE|nr:glutathione synthetase [Kwoniella dejecticola CBS 10117]OBR87665.1 glutathione synthetase [Kwoniella dejecticola CBS 10117]
MSVSTTLPDWPPALTPEQHQHLILLSSTYALSHGFTLLPPQSANPPTSAISAPLTLLPTPFPRGLYELAVALQPLYNALYARITLDWEFLDRVMGGSVSKVDSFQGELWRGWKSIRNDLVQPLQLGLFRSDYLLHETQGEELSIKQVEFNTIAASFGALSQRASEMHRYLQKATDGFYSISPHLTKPSNIPQNEPLRNLASGLAQGWKAYGKDDAVILFVVQEGERNVFDQRWLEYELLESHGIQVIRHTFSELSSLATIDPSTKNLLLPSPLQPSSPPKEVSVVYYRAAYTPTDYPTSAEWTTRILLEQSKAIKCPSMALQLSGAKKIQQVLSEPGVLEDFLLGKDRPDVGFGVGAGSLTRADVDKLRSSWIGLYPMDDSSYGQKAYELAITEPERFVLKPQREGGGNNIYRENIPTFLKELEAEAREDGEPSKKEGYILMELIEPPKGLRNHLVKGGDNHSRNSDIVSELGVYGVSLFGGDVKQNITSTAGTLLRTKGRESDEGGVAIGISSIDSPLLID